MSGNGNGWQDEKCYACGRKFRKNSHGRIVFHPEALTIDGQRQFVGYDCFAKIVEGGKGGFQPPRGGPRLFEESTAPMAVLTAAGISRTIHEHTK